METFSLTLSSGVGVLCADGELSCIVGILQGAETPLLKSIQLAGPGVPAEPAAEDIEGRVIALRCCLSNLRHAETAAALPADAQAAVAEQVAALEVQVDKQLLRLFDAAVKQERLDCALQLIGGCVADTCTHPHCKRTTMSCVTHVKSAAGCRCDGGVGAPGCFRQQAAACRCEMERTLTMAIKLANHKRKSMLAERVQAIMEWRFPAQEADAHGEPACGVRLACALAVLPSAHICNPLRRRSPRPREMK